MPNPIEGYEPHPYVDCVPAFESRRGLSVELRWDYFPRSDSTFSWNLFKINSNFKIPS